MLAISAVNAYVLYSKISGRVHTKLYYTMESIFTESRIRQSLQHRQEMLQLTNKGIKR
jgi:hypothetical protein